MEKRIADKGTNHNPEKLRWHPAFLQAIQQELFEYRNSLEFKYEYQLTSEPLRIDLLIIKKPKHITIDKNIARIFRSDNIIEYKSPSDNLLVKDFLKVYAYANLYVAITSGADFSEITITFVGNKYPRKLLEYLVDIRGYKVEKPYPGIYIVTGDYLPIQIIESKRLSENENLWLKSLTNNLEIGTADAILKTGKKRVGQAPLDAYLDVILRANPEIFLEVQNMANGTMTFEEVFTKAGIIPQWIERGIEQEKEKTVHNLFAMDMPIEKIAHVTELSVEKINSLLRL